MGTTIPTFGQWLNARYQERIKMEALLLAEEKRKALKELLDAAPEQI